MLCPVIFPFSAVHYVPNRNTVNERTLISLSEEVVGRGGCGDACGLMWSNVCFKLHLSRYFVGRHDGTFCVGYVSHHKITQRIGGGIQSDINIGLMMVKI